MTSTNSEKKVFKLFKAVRTAKDMGDYGLSKRAMDVLVSLYSQIDDVKVMKRLISKSLFLARNNVKRRVIPRHIQIAAVKLKLDV